MKEVAPFDLEYVLTPVTLLSAISVVFTAMLLTPLLSKRYFKQYNIFTYEEKVYWSTLPSATLHAVVACALISYAFLSGSVDTSNMIRSDSSVGFLSMQISTGYFVGDMIVCFSHKSLREFSTALHHISSLLSVALGLVFRGRWMILILARLFSELSTPFVHLRWVLAACKVPKTSPWFSFAALSMSLTFFLSRTFAIPFLWYIIITIMVQETDPHLLTYTPYFIQVTVIVLTVFLDVLNLFWSYKIARGCLKFLGQQKAKE